jgi:hypothetical protein
MSMDVFIYFAPDIDVEKDVIEDALDDAIGELGEVTGGGSGEKGMNIDLDVEDDADPGELVDLIRGALKSLGVTPSKIVIDGKAV